MERLTEKINGWTFEETVKSAENLMEAEENMFKWDVLRHLRDFAESYKGKIAEYEDFEEIFREKMTDMVCEFLSDKEEFGKWLDRNKWIAKKCDEYARAEVQGLLVRLPCKVGDTVYAFYYGKKHFSECQIKEIEIKHTHYGNVLYLIEPIGHRGHLYRYYEDDFGKTLFFTQAEAERKLKEMECE